MMTLKTPQHPSPFAFLLALVMLVSACAVSPACAQSVKPWTPANDTLWALAAQAKVKFQSQRGDSANGPNYEAFELCAEAGRRLLRSLGRQHMLQAVAIEPTLDSLGLDVEVTNDPNLPAIVFMLVRNPYRPKSDAIGYLYWYRGHDLRMQGTSFPRTQHPRLHSWWSGRNGSPYSAGLLFTRLTQPDSLGFRLFRMSADGTFWNLIDYEGHGPRMSGHAQADLMDVNGDGQPELVVFDRAEPDSFLRIPDDVPPLLAEYLYTESNEGFVLHDARPVPSATSALRMFALMLQRGDRENAKRLLLKPERMLDALANGWDKARGPGAWTIEYGEENQPWPQWYEVKIRTPLATKKYIFHFFIQDGRWVIRDWIAVQPSAPPPPHGTPGLSLPDSLRGLRK
jgi:hypothetical protein